MSSFSISGSLARSAAFRHAVRSFSAAVFVIALLCGCSPQSPQRPSQRSGQKAEVDSATLAMLELHQRLADAADIELNRYIQEHPGKWFSQEDGSWCVWQQTAGNSLPAAGDVLQVRLVTRDLEGHLLSDVQGEYELGQCQLPSAVENILSAVTHPTSNITPSSLGADGGSCRFMVLAPWYVAYGSKGNDVIPGYQNVIIEVYIL